MTSLARMACLLATMLAGAASAMPDLPGVLLPPIGGAAAPPVLPPPVLPPPKVDTGPPLRDPPVLGQPLVPGTPVGMEVTAAPLRLEEVLGSVEAHFPAIRAAEQERQLAEAGQISSRGAFDLNLRSQESSVSGTYDNQRYGVGLSQLTPAMGASFFAGYRLGAGSYPVYYGDRKTGEGGEFVAGATLPLLRGREIDSSRAKVRKADLDRALAEPHVLAQRLEAARAASRAYWAWAAAGQRYLVAREVLRIAVGRDEQLGKRVAAGNLARIEQEDNRQRIVERQGRLVVALRAMQQSAITLSMYLRGPNGMPLQPTLAQLPAFALPTGPPNEAAREMELEQALTQRPETRRLALQREKVLVDLRLAENQMLPGLNVGVAAARDMGFGLRSPQSSSPLAREVYEASVVLDVPLQRREARGRILGGRAELARIAALEQLARDRISLEVRDAGNALERAHDLLRQGRDNRLQAAYMEDAERRLFDIGKSDLLRVNLREVAAADARFGEIDAAAEFYRALADYIAALGLAPGD